MDLVRDWEDVFQPRILEEHMIMKNLKRTIVLLAVMMSLTVYICAWAEEKTSYTFTTGTAQIEAGQEWNKARKILGKEKASKNLSDFINGGNIVTYIYDDCEIRTAKNIKKKTIIEAIDLTGSAVTEEGLSLGQTPADVKRLYPTAQEEMGLYTAELGDSRILIDCGVDNKRVVSIRYEYTGRR
jgi:hypothetical protein